MKIRGGFILREIADSIVVVPSGDLTKEFKGMIDLNRTGKFIWELLEKNLSVDEITNKLMEKYKIDEDKARQSTEGFIEKLRGMNVLEE